MRTTYGLPKKREEVIELLQNAFVQQNLDEAEYEIRLSEAHDAKSLEELEAIIHDFPREIRHQIFPPHRQQHSQQTTPRTSYTDETPMEQHSIHRAIMSSPTDKLRVHELSGRPVFFSTILGKQQADFRLSVVDGYQGNIKIECVLGETILDLRNEYLQNTQIHISVTGALGTVKIMLPRGAEIDPRVTLIGGELKIRDKQRGWLRRMIGQTEPTTEPINCMVTITGSFWLGQIMVIY